MKKNLVFIVVLCTALCSCNLSRKYYNPDVQRDKDLRVCCDTLQLNQVQSESADVYKLLCIDNYLVMAQMDRKGLFRVLDISTNEELAVFGQLGHARNEVGAYPFFDWQIYCIRDDKGQPMLFVQDGVCTKVIDLRKSVAAKKCVVTRVIREKKSHFHGTYYLPCQKQFVYKRVSYDDPRDNIFFPPEFSFMDGEEKKWDIYPDIVEPKDFPQSADADYDHTMIVSPDGQYIASINIFIDITTIFDLSKKQSLGVVNPNSYTYEFLENEITQSNAHDKIRTYNITACATDKCFIVLESGKTLKEIDDDEKNERENRGLKLCGYDWEGNCLFAYCIDKNISNIAYDDVNHKLYAIDKINGSLYECILKYNDLLMANVEALTSCEIAI